MRGAAQAPTARVGRALEGPFIPRVLATRRTFRARGRHSPRGVQASASSAPPPVAQSGVEEGCLPDLWRTLRTNCGNAGDWPHGPHAPRGSAHRGRAQASQRLPPRLPHNFLPAQESSIQVGRLPDSRATCPQVAPPLVHPRQPHTVFPIRLLVSGLTGREAQGVLLVSTVQAPPGSGFVLTARAC